MNNNIHNSFNTINNKTTTFDDLIVTFKPNLDQINEIEYWLIEEYKNSGEGFHCNWKVIFDSFNRNEIGVILVDNKTIGFIIWSKYNRVAKIEIAEIRQEFRRMGYGRILAEILFIEMKKQGVSTLKLHCAPPESEIVWKKLGFKQFPAVEDFKIQNSDKGKHLFKVIVPYAKPIKSNGAGVTIELWSVEPYQIEKIEPQWKWVPKFQKATRKLVKPIIAPAKGDWNIRWSENGKVVMESKVKRFGRNYYNDFLIIDELLLT